MNKISDFEYFGNYFDAEFDDSGLVQKVELRVESGFSVDSILVTDKISDVLREALEEKNQMDIEFGGDGDRAYETWRDNKREGA